MGSNKTVDYDEKIDAAIGALPAMTPEDFLLMALACLDQGGVSVADQKKVYDLLGFKFGPGPLARPSSEQE